MSIRSRRALGALAAAALSCLSVVGLQATAASAAEVTASHECYLDGVRVPCTPDEVLPIPVFPELPDRGQPPLPPREYDPSATRPPANDDTKPVSGNDHSVPYAASFDPGEYDPNFTRPPGDPFETPGWPENDYEYGPTDAPVSLASVAADGSGRPVVEYPPVRVESAAASGRPITDNPSYKPIWCTDVETGEVFQCGWQS